jgi:hypothetical protein
MDQKRIILSFILTYVNTTVNNSSITEANYNTQIHSFILNIVSRTNVILYLKNNNRSSFIYLVYTKHSIYERIISWNWLITLKSGYPLRMHLAETNRVFIPVIHLGYY